MLKGFYFKISILFMKKKIKRQKDYKFYFIVPYESLDFFNLTTINV